MAEPVRKSDKDLFDDLILKEHKRITLLRKKKEYEKKLLERQQRLAAETQTSSAESKTSIPEKPTPSSPEQDTQPPAQSIPNPDQTPAQDLSNPEVKDPLQSENQVPSETTNLEQTPNTATETPSEQTPVKSLKTSLELQIEMYRQEHEQAEAAKVPPEEELAPPEEEVEDSILEILLEKKYNLFLLRKLRVGNPETLNIFTHPETIQKLIEYLSADIPVEANKTTTTTSSENKSTLAKRAEFQETSQLVLSTGRREISQLLQFEETDFLSKCLLKIPASGSFPSSFSHHFTKILVAQLDYNYSETAQYLNQHPEILSVLTKHIGSKGVTELFLELLSLHSKQHQPKITFLSTSLVPGLLSTLIFELNSVIIFRKQVIRFQMMSIGDGVPNGQEGASPQKPEGSGELSGSVDSIIQILIHLLESSPELSYPIFEFSNMSALVRKIIESDSVSEFYQLLEKLIEVNMSWIKKANHTGSFALNSRSRFATSSSFGSFGNWTTQISNFFPMGQTTTGAAVTPNPPPNSENLSNLYSSSSFVGESAIPICVFENGELVPVIVKEILLCLPRLKFRLFRYHPLEKLSHSSTPQSLTALPLREDRYHLKLEKRLSSQQIKFRRRQKKLVESPNPQQEQTNDITKPPDFSSSPSKQFLPFYYRAEPDQKTENEGESRGGRADQEPGKKVEGDDEEEEVEEKEDDEEDGDVKDEDQLIMVVVPLGLQRWAIVRLLLNLVTTGFHSVDNALVNSRILSVCIRLFLSHNCSNILHCTIVEMLYQIFQRSRLTLIQYLIEKLNLPGLLIEAFQTLPPPGQSDFVSFREHLLIVISLLSRENRFAQNLLSHHEPWKFFVGQIQPFLDANEIDNFYKKNSHRFLM
eukprot:TRINITY_DN2141_c0_g2_i1.p1 TRINITY_DN2141_c0_g2~~TRINITY_DN2141_c0_g2_i1.p1  ORF type:complete len:872 (-),score=233.11 TRINITY_DN2141_c0_g2_i1:283-2898(-)